MLYEYHSDSIRGPLLVVALLLIGTVLVPTLLLRLALLATASGPGFWVFIQWRRRGRGVQVAADHVLVQGSLTGRARCVAFAALRGYTVTQSGSLLLAYRQKDDEAPIAKPARSPGSLALTDLRPESHRRPRYKLVATPPLDHADALQTALDSAAIPPPDDRVFPPDQLRLWARSRRVRNLILAFLILMGTPLYMIILGRTLAGLLNMIGGGN